MKANYKPGQWNAICDICGFEFKSGELRKNWQGLMVCTSDFEQRHPQELIRAVRDDPSTEWNRSEPPDVYANPCTIAGQQGVSGFGVAGCLLTNYVGPYEDLNFHPTPESSGPTTWTFTASSLEFPEAASTLTQAGLSDGNTTAFGSICGTGGDLDAYIMADFGKDVYVSTARIASMGNGSYYGWNELFTNGATLQYATAASPTTWNTVTTLSGHTPAGAKSYYINATCRYVRIYKYSDNVGVGDFWFT